MANYRLEIKRSAAKEIERLPQRDRKRIVDRIGDLRHNPRPIGVKKLAGEDAYRIRQGDYRIIYRVFDEIVTVSVVKVAHRGSVYRS